MSTGRPQPVDAPTPSRPAWVVALQRLFIWALFLALVWLARDFFFMAFMTFLISYVTLALVGRAMKRLSPNEERPGLRRLVTFGVFLAIPLVLVGVGLLIGPVLVAQAEQLAGWLNQANMEKEVARILEGIVGPREFAEKYGTSTDPRYVKALEEFRTSGERHVAEYNDFPHVEAWVEAGFKRQFLEAERGQVRQQLAKEGTSSKAFADWFLTRKAPQLQVQGRKAAPAPAEPKSALDALVRAAATAKPEQLLEQARHDPAALARLEQEWIQAAVDEAVASAPGSKAYLERFRAYYDKQRARSPTTIPYTFDQYVELQKVRPQGPRAFGDALEKMMPTPEADSEARLRADFEAAKKHELFHEWWASSGTARFVRHQIGTRLSGGDPNHMDKVVSSLLNIPVDLSTAMILALFICIDFPHLRLAAQRLRETWLRDAYDEITPVFRDLTELIGLSFRAQGMIALCNAVLLFIGLTILGVEHAVFLGVAAFLLCLVPTLGTVLVWALIVLMALVQPGGGVGLALRASGLVLLVILIENFILAPRIVGRTMELHPVLIIALLPLAQYFFGVWGLILATPVAVYVIHVVILRRGLPGKKTPTHPALAGPHVLPADSAPRRSETEANRGEALSSPPAKDTMPTASGAPSAARSAGAELTSSNVKDT